jgi:hypothetical protein
LSSHGIDLLVPILHMCVGQRTKQCCDTNGAAHLELAPLKHIQGRILPVHRALLAFNDTYVRSQERAFGAGSAVRASVVALMRDIIIALVVVSAS